MDKADYTFTIICVVVLLATVLYAIDDASGLAQGTDPTATPPFAETKFFIPYVAKPPQTATPPIPATNTQPLPTNTNNQGGKSWPAENQEPLWLTSQGSFE